ncbi:MAG TPA: HNH endonuclease signature motif containing protein [Solirubrobacterales bacterium]|jgi:hypothetical protein|nr:HNH endonuclease signature motif containing protein [Solirubrobacterales bacterium]
MSQPKRDWSDANGKRDYGCRVCGRYEVELAHTIGRKHDQPKTPGSKTRYVHPDSVVPLCPSIHRAYDAHQFDLLGYLTTAEQAKAVEQAGGIESARRRLYPSAYRTETAA